MSGEAEVKLKFVSDEKALATMEAKLEKLTNSLNQMAAAGKRAGQTKVDPTLGQGKATVDRWQAANDRAMMSAQRIAQAPAIMQTRNTIAQVRAQQAAKEAAKQHAEELAKQPSLIESAGGAALRYLGPLALAATAVKLIGNEWANVIERQQKAAQSAITFEEALGESVLNVGDVMSPDKMKERALAMSAETGVAPATAVQAISLAIKSGGATNEAEADRLSQAAVVAGRLSPRASPEKLADTAGSIASYMTRTGATAEQAGGTLLSMQSKSNIADANKAMAAMGPTLANMLAQGASEGLAQSLAPALSQAIEDTQGDVSSLAATQFTSSLTEQFGQREGFKGKANIPDLAIAAMRADPELAREFFETGLQSPETGRSYGKPELGRGKAETFFRAISGDKTLAGDPNIIGSYVRQLDEYQKGALTNQQAGEFYGSRLQQVRGATPTLKASQTLRSATEANRITGADALQGVIRDDLKELLQSAGATDIEQKISQWSGDLSGGDPLLRGAEDIRKRATLTRRNSFGWGERFRRDVSADFSGEGETFDQRLRNEYATAANARDEETAKRLDRAAKALEEIAANNAKRPFDRKGNVETIENN